MEHPIAPRDDSQADFAEIVEHMPECCGIYAAVRNDAGHIVDFRLQFLNAAARHAEEGARPREVNRLLSEMRPGHWMSGMFDAYCHVVESGEPLHKTDAAYDDPYEAAHPQRLFDIHARPLGDGFVAYWREITAERATLAERDESRHRVATLVEQSVDGLLVIDADGVIEFTNPAASHLLAERCSPIVGTHFGIPAVEAPVELLIPSRQDSRAIELRATEIQWKGHPAYLASLRDITEHKRADEALRQSRNLLQAVFDGLPLALFVMDPVARTIVSANQAVADIFGYEPGELIGRTSECLHVDRDHFEAFAQRAVPALNATGSWSGEFELRRRDGTVFPSEHHFTVLPDADGGWTHAVNLVADISHRKRAEEELQQSEQRLRSIIENAVEVITVVDEQGTFLLASPSTEPTLGYTPDEFVGRNAFELIHPDDVPAARAVFGRALAEPGVPQRMEMRVRHQDGSWRLLDSVGRKAKEGDALGGTLVSSRDVTELREVEAHLRQSHKMEAIGSLAGGVAHDFNNMLSVIISYSAFLLDNFREGDPGRHDVEQIQAAAERAATLTRQLLAFSRRQTLRVETLDLNAIVRDMEKMVGRLIGEHIKLRTGLAQGLRKVRADAGQLEQILMNLAVNSRDAMPRGGQLIVETANATLDAEYARAHLGAQAGDYVMLSVSDTGCGMDEATRQRVFEPFFTTKETGKGTGLGLSTVYGIVKQLEGSIWLYSEPDHGTTIKIFLPAAHAKGAAQGHKPAAPASLEGRETVLVVEDEDSVRMTASRILRGRGYTVHEARNGEEALRFCAEHAGTIDMVLTDVIMPNMGGAELAEHLQRVAPGLRVLFTSGYTDDAISDHGVVGEDIAFLEKPFAAQSLLQAVRGVLDR